MRDWRVGRCPRPRALLLPGAVCLVDGDLRPNPPKEPYAYLLGMYLGDGCLSATRRDVWRLRIACDAQYRGILEECCAAMEAIFPEKHAYRQPQRHSACVELSMYSKLWIHLFPQHGPGRKHLRPIKLLDWQKDIVEEFPGLLLRGLIHSDGCRIIARECKNGHVRYAPRYSFSNLSEDIKRIFCDACDLLGIRWTRPNARSIAIYRLASVARMDEFVGPKY